MQASHTNAHQDLGKPYLVSISAETAGQHPLWEWMAIPGEAQSANGHVPFLVLPPPPYAQGAWKCRQGGVAYKLRGSRK